jgi:hypothetical protein
MADESQNPVGDADREEAVRRLSELHDQGHLGSHDFEDRRGRARDALTRADLDAVFRDLPAPGRLAPGSQVAGPAGELPQVSSREGWFNKSRRDAVSWLVVFGAVFLFFRTGSWLWFLLIPASAVVWQLLTGREGD